jgi:hypothetical protein
MAGSGRGVDPDDDLPDSDHAEVSAAEHEPGGESGLAPDASDGANEPPPRPGKVRRAGGGRGDGRPVVRVSRRRFLVLVALLLGLGAAGWEILQRAGRQLIGLASLTPGGSASGVSVSPRDTEFAGESEAPGETEPPEGLRPVESAPIETGPPAGPNRAALENQLRGSDRWNLPLNRRSEIEGYVNAVSFVAGESVLLRMQANVPAVTVTAYRLGWYGRAGGRPVGRWKDVAVRPQPAPVSDPNRGMIRCEWDTALTFQVPQDWVSGIYLLLLEAKGAAPGYVPFFVREPVNQAAILFLSGMTAYQAYNSWGGKSLYSDGSAGTATASGGANAVTVSFDRPYDNNRGGGRMLRWDPQFVRWMESRGFDAAYAADLDLELHPEIVQGRRLLVFNGHPEYWSLGMRRTLESAIGNGTNVAFFTANEIYWRVRFEDLAGGRHRTVTCYRSADLDPLAASNPQEATTKWREQPSPVPESLVLGQMYGHMVKTPSDFVCTQPDHWIYAGTGMKAGDTIRNLVGQEYDRFWPDPSLHPVGVTILAESPVQPNYGNPNPAATVSPDEPQPPVHNATIYTAPSGATVFSAGTIHWGWGLDSWGNQDYQGVHTPVDPRAQRITENILIRLGT